MRSRNIQQIQQLLNQGKREEAIFSAALAVKNDPMDVDAWMFLASLVEDPLQKIDCYRRVLHLQPEHTAARLQLDTLTFPDAEGIKEDQATFEASPDAVAAPLSEEDIFGESSAGENVRLFSEEEIASAPVDEGVAPVQPEGEVISELMLETPAALLAEEKITSEPVDEEVILPEPEGEVISEPMLETPAALLAEEKFTSEPVDEEVILPEPEGEVISEPMFETPAALLVDEKNTGELVDEELIPSQPEEAVISEPVAETAAALLVEEKITGEPADEEAITPPPEEMILATMSGEDAPDREKKEAPDGAPLLEAEQDDAFDDAMNMEQLLEAFSSLIEQDSGTVTPAQANAGLSNDVVSENREEEISSATPQDVTPVPESRSLDEDEQAIFRRIMQADKRLSSFSTPQNVDLSDALSQILVPGAPQIPAEDVIEKISSSNPAEEVQEILEIIPLTPSKEMAIPAADASEQVPMVAAGVTAEKNRPRFRLYQEITLRDQEGQAGIIISEPFLAQRRWNYEVFFQENDRRILSEEDLFPPSEQPESAAIEELRRDLALVKLNYPLSDHFYSINASRIPSHLQNFKPAARLIASGRNRLWIADGDGLTKILSAGLAMLELQARQPLRRILIVSPSVSVQKWCDHLQARFMETFTPLDLEKLREFITGYQKYGKQTMLKGVVPLDLIRRDEFCETIATLPILFDLVILDEAYLYQGANSRSHQCASILSLNTDGLILLGNASMTRENAFGYNLLQLVSPGEFLDSATFINKVDSLEHISRAAELLLNESKREALAELRKVEGTVRADDYLNNPIYHEVLQLLNQERLPKDDRRIALEGLSELNPCAALVSRDKTLEETVASPFCRVSPLRVELAQEEQEFYDTSLEYVRDQFIWAKEKDIQNTSLSALWERQAASCIPTAVKRINETNTRGIQSLDLEDELVLDDILAFDFDSEYRLDMQNRGGEVPSFMLAAAKGTSGIDTKTILLVRTIRSVLQENPSAKIVVYSAFRHTVVHLSQRLQDMGYTAFALHGGQKLEERQAYIESFQSKPEYHLLLCSDAAVEGLDLSVCDTIIHYDIPWNPLRVIQRMQMVVLVSPFPLNVFVMVIQKSIEEHVLYRLYNKLHVFERTHFDHWYIIKEEVRDLARVLLQSSLSREEEERLADRTARSITLRQREENEEATTMVYILQQEEANARKITNARDDGRFLSESELRALVSSYLSSKYQHTHLESEGVEDGVYSLFPTEELLGDLQLQRFISQADVQRHEEILTLLPAGRRMKITFSEERAACNVQATFVTSCHPFLQEARRFWSQGNAIKKRIYTISLENTGEIRGDYYFFIFSVYNSGIHAGHTLSCVAISMDDKRVHVELSRHLLRLLQKANSSITNRLSEKIQWHVFAQAEQIAKDYVCSKREQALENLQPMRDAIYHQRRSEIERTLQEQRSVFSQEQVSALPARARRIREAQAKTFETKTLIALNRMQALQEACGWVRLEMCGYLQIAS